MNHFARICSLAAALGFGLPATGFCDHGGSHGGGGGGGWSHGGNFSHGNFHGGNFHGGSFHGGHFYCAPRVHVFGSFFPFYSYYPYYSGGYYDTGYYDSYYDAPYYNAPSYRTSYQDHGDSLAIDVQRALRRDGYYHGSVDGDVGAGTRAAIRQFQFDHNLEVTGRIDRALLRSLGLD